MGAPIVQTDGASASVIVPCTTKSRRWRAIKDQRDLETLWKRTVKHVN